jgi:NADH-quinone oxidoreductase subunit N
MPDPNFFPLVLPVLVLVAYALLALVMSPAFRGQSWILGPVSLIGVAMAGWFTRDLWKSWQAVGPMEGGYGMVRVDGFGLFAASILLVITGLSILGSMRFLEREDADHGEFYPLLLIAAAGMVMMVQTTHLIMVLVGLEVFSISLYILSGLTRGRVRSIESSLKYFLLGAFSSGFFVYGTSLLYGATGSLDILTVGRAAESDPSPMLWLGMGLVFIGLAFKIAVVPFHHWVPDVYEGAPTNVTGFMAAATKTAAFAALMRFLTGGFGATQAHWDPLVSVLAVLTMTVANLVALAQTNIKRLLAFSSISHAGYLMIALVCIPEVGVRAVLIYLLAYAFMTVGAFAVAAAVGRGDAAGESGYELRAWAGLGRRRPWLALAMSVFLFSLAGIPPTAGFLGKYVIFTAAVQSGRIGLAVIGVVNAVIGAYYYLNVLVAMWMRESDAAEAGTAPISVSAAAVVALSAAATLGLGVLPSAFLEAAKGLAAALL